MMVHQCDSTELYYMLRNLLNHLKKLRWSRNSSKAGRTNESAQWLSLSTICTFQDTIASITSSEGVGLKPTRTHVYRIQWLTQSDILAISPCNITHKLYSKYKFTYIVGQTFVKKKIGLQSSSKSQTNQRSFTWTPKSMSVCILKNAIWINYNIFQSSEDHHF